MNPSTLVADPCIVCGGLAVALLHKSTFQAPIEEAPSYFLAHRTATAHGRIVRCESCGFTFTSPRFSAADYDAIYGRIQLTAGEEASFDGAKRARFRRISRIVRGHIHGSQQFLDLGCGDGSFLRSMDNANGRGFEIGAPARRRAGSSEVIIGDWTSFAGSADCPEASLDYLTAIDVLEHLPRIQEDVQRIRQVLKPGGLFFASVPNIDSWVAKVMGSRWNMLLLEHLWYFSPATLRRFLAKYGFEEIEVRRLPYDAPLNHVATRLAQTFGMQGKIGQGAFSRLVVPAPAGILLGVYRAVTPP